MKMKKIILLLLLLLCTSFVASYAQEQTLFSADTKQESQENYFEYSTSFTDNIECRGIQVKNEKLVFYIDSNENTMLLNVKPIPLNTTNRRISYKSSDESIIKVDEHGLMQSQNKGGSAKITITCDGVTKEITVDVIRAVSGVKLSRSDMLFYIDQYASEPLKAEVLPADATNKKVSYKSSDTAVAYVDENGVVSPVGTGSAKVSVTTDDGGFSDSCTVYVQIADTPVRACYITNAIDCMRVGEEYTLKGYIYPQNAKNSAIMWHSSDESVVSVNNGTLKGISEGMSVITASTQNGCEDSFTIVVYGENDQVVSKVISQNVEERIAQISMPVTYSRSKYTLNEAINIQLKSSPTVFTSTASKATQSDVAKYINNKSLNSGYGKYQFLDLRKTNGINEDRLNKYLSNKGILRGKANIFIDAAKQYGISEIYLAVHSVHESGNGTSELACGVDYNQKKVYNLFGIGAYDDNPVEGGAKYAYEQGWTSIDKAIYGAAQWISAHYINSGQNTLYKMRWNPEKPGFNQYATDVAWAQKQASVLKSLVEGVNSPVSFDVSLYNNDDEFAIKYD